MSSFLSGKDLNKYVVHAYYHPDFPEILTWHVVGRRVDAIIASTKTYETSKFLTANDLGLAESVLVSMHAWLQMWMFYNGQEDPRSMTHSMSYLEAKRQVENLTNIIHPTVKRCYTVVAYA